jgi:hypothetical protein
MFEVIPKTGVFMTHIKKFPLIQAAFSATLVTLGNFRFE